MTMVYLFTYCWSDKDFVPGWQKLNVFGHIYTTRFSVPKKISITDQEIECGQQVILLFKTEIFAFPS